MKMIAWAVAVLFAAGTGFLQDQNRGQEKPKKREMKDRVWVEGGIVCIGCTLAKQQGVDSQCTLHAKHAQGFLDEKGSIWTLVDNARGHRVITNEKLRDKPVKLFGWQYKKHQYVELWKYSLKEKDKWIGYDFCKT